MREVSVRMTASPPTLPRLNVLNKIIIYGCDEMA
jgi:hypothetical protein